MGTEWRDIIVYLRCIDNLLQRHVGTIQNIGSYPLPLPPPPRALLDNINRVCPYCKTVYDDCLRHLVAECEYIEAIRQGFLTFVETEISLVLYLELSNAGAETFLQYVHGAPFISNQ